MDIWKRTAEYDYLKELEGKMKAACTIHHKNVPFFDGDDKIIKEQEEQYNETITEKYKPIE